MSCGATTRSPTRRHSRCHQNSLWPSRVGRICSMNGVSRRIGAAASSSASTAPPGGVAACTAWSRSSWIGPVSRSCPGVMSRYQTGLGPRRRAKVLVKADPVVVELDPAVVDLAAHHPGVVQRRLGEAHGLLGGGHLREALGQVPGHPVGRVCLDARAGEDAHQVLGRRRGWIDGVPGEVDRKVDRSVRRFSRSSMVGMVPILAHRS
jgi:hypothetical protein